MPALRPVVAIGTFALCLAACTDWGAGPDITGSTPTAVTIRYDADQVSAAAAEDVARRYCAGLDKVAHLRGRFANTPSLTYADYNCQTGPAPGP